MTTSAAANLAEKLTNSGPKRVWRWAFCVLFLLIFMGPVLMNGQLNSTPQAASPEGVTSVVQAERRSKLRAERRAEIRQREIDNPEAEDGENVYRHSAMVKKLASAFGLSVEATSRMFEVVNFVLLVILIVWAVAKILPKALQSRTERIRNEIEQARIATEDANRRLANVEERLSRLDSDIETIRTQAQQETAAEEKRLRAALEQEKQSILTSATQDIDAATKNAQSQLKKLAADLVIGHAKRQIAVTPEADQSLVARFLTDVNEKRPGGGVN
jgi:F-type H+-transporting ATPase subunit b